MKNFILLSFRLRLLQENEKILNTRYLHLSLFTTPTPHISAQFIIWIKVTELIKGGISVLKNDIIRKQMNIRENFFAHNADHFIGKLGHMGGNYFLDHFNQFYRSIGWCESHVLLLFSLLAFPVICSAIYSPNYPSLALLVTPPLPSTFYPVLSCPTTLYSYHTPHLPSPSLPPSRSSRL
jgi:hypothetical protein